MRQEQTTLSVNTQGQGLYEITDNVTNWVRAKSITSGLLTLFIRHTSASLTIQENADPDVQHDLIKAFQGLAPEGAPYYRHTTEGPDDMPAHIKSALSDVSLSIPVSGGRPTLGTWQGIYVFEHRYQAHTRSVVCHLIGE